MNSLSSRSIEVIAPLSRGIAWAAEFAGVRRAHPKKSPPTCLPTLDGGTHRYRPRGSGWVVWRRSRRQDAGSEKKQPALIGGHHSRPADRFRSNTILLRALIARGRVTRGGSIEQGAESGPTHGQTGYLKADGASGQLKLADRLLLPSDHPLSSGSGIHERRFSRLQQQRQQRVGTKPLLRPGPDEILKVSQVIEVAPKNGSTYRFSFPVAMPRV